MTVSEVGFNTRARRAHALIFMLEEKYPSAFFMFERRRRPLKLGIHKDLIAAHPDIDHRVIRLAIKLYTLNPGYQAAVIRGDNRIDLAGNPSAGATSEEIDRARSWLNDYRSKRKAKAREEQAKAIAPPPPKRLGFADLRAAAAARRGATG